MLFLSSSQDNLELIFDQFILDISYSSSHQYQDFRINAFQREILSPTFPFENQFNYNSKNSLYTCLYHIISKHGFPEMIFSSHISIIEENQQVDDVDFDFDITIDFDLNLNVNSIDTPHPILMPTQTNTNNNIYLLEFFDEKNDSLFLYLDQFI